MATSDSPRSEAVPQPSDQQRNGASSPPAPDVIAAPRTARTKHAIQRAWHQAGSLRHRASGIGDDAGELAKDVGPDVAQGASKAKQIVERHPVTSAIAGAYVLGFAKGRKRRRHARRKRS